mmetsp:Transcript_141026/g.245817  ORF Transcript_141026/g.245817 Transcript_141026/m.245817 type:complete len:930 (-) Transcript_141026:860-3649(-)
MQLNGLPSTYSALTGCPFRNPADCPFQRDGGGHGCGGANAYAFAPRKPPPVHRTIEPLELPCEEQNLESQVERLKAELEITLGRLEGKQAQVNSLEHDLEDTQQRLRKVEAHVMYICSHCTRHLHHLAEEMQHASARIEDFPLECEGVAWMGPPPKPVCPSNKLQLSSSNLDEEIDMARLDTIESWERIVNDPGKWEQEIYWQLEIIKGAVAKLHSQQSNFLQFKAQYESEATKLCHECRKVKASQEEIQGDDHDGMHMILLLEDAVRKMGVEVPFVQCLVDMVRGATDTHCQSQMSQSSNEEGLGTHTGDKPLGGDILQHAIAMEIQNTINDLVKKKEELELAMQHLQLENEGLEERRKQVLHETEVLLKAKEDTTLEATFGNRPIQEWQEIQQIRDSAAAERSLIEEERMAMEQAREGIANEARQVLYEMQEKAKRDNEASELARQQAHKMLQEAHEARVALEAAKAMLDEEKRAWSTFLKDGATTGSPRLDEEERRESEEEADGKVLKTFEFAKGQIFFRQVQGRRTLIREEQEARIDVHLEAKHKLAEDPSKEALNIYEKECSEWKEARALILKERAELDVAQLALGKENELLSDQKAALAIAEKQVQREKEDLKDARLRIDKERREHEKERAALEVCKIEVDKQRQALERAQLQIEKEKQEFEEAKVALESAKADLEGAKQTREQLQLQMDKEKVEYDDAREREMKELREMVQAKQKAAEDQSVEAQAAYEKERLEWEVARAAALKEKAEYDVVQCSLEKQNELLRNRQEALAIAEAEMQRERLEFQLAFDELQRERDEYAEVCEKERHALQRMKEMLAAEQASVKKDKDEVAFAKALREQKGTDQQTCPVCYWSPGETAVLKATMLEMEQENVALRSAQALAEKERLEYEDAKEDQRAQYEKLLWEKEQLAQERKKNTKQCEL